MKVETKNLIRNDNINPYKDIETFIKKEKYKNFNPLIEVRNLSHKFKTKNKEKIIYENINFEIFENERLAFLGPNGAGKTLTISTLCGIIKQKSGEIKYNFEYDKKPHEKLSVQFQDLQFPSSLSPKDLIEFSLEIQDVNEVDEEVKEAIEIFEIDKIINTKMSKLSGGQQQRVNVFMALIGKPKVLFLDEFTTGLDIAIKTRIQNYILKFCEKNKISLVIISHDIDCIEDMVDRIIILADKRIIIDAMTSDINKKYSSVKKMLKKYILV